MNIIEIVKQYYEILICVGKKFDKEEQSAYIPVSTTIGEEGGLIPISTSVYDKMQIEFNESQFRKQKFFLDLGHRDIVKIKHKIQKEIDKDIQFYGGFLVEDVEADRFVLLKYNVLESEPVLLFIAKK